MLRRLRGHAWTIAPTLSHRLRNVRQPYTSTWSATVHDPVVGDVALTGALDPAPEARVIAVIVHGMAGTPDSYYVRRAAAAARRAGCAALRLALRGADRRGEDIYHGALTADLHAAIASPALAGYERIVVVGYSLGGHAALRLAAEDCDPRVVAVAAVCSPLDLGTVQRHLDAPRGVVYRRYLLGGLSEIYAAVHRRRGGPVPVERARRIRRFLDWDDAIVAPRFGFADALDYYRKASVAPLLGQLRVPSLLVEDRGDPVVPERALRPFLPADDASRGGMLDVRWIDCGGHVGFPPRADLGVDAPRGLEPQVLGWLLSRAGER